MEKVKKPTVCVIAGPNGSGKTTTTKQLLSNEWGVLRILRLTSHA